MFRIVHRRSKQVTLPDELPWMCLVGSGVVLQKDGALQKTFEVRGPDLTSATLAERANEKRQINEALMRYGTGWAMFSESARRECGYISTSTWPNLCGWICDVEREQILSHGQQFVSSYFITFVHKPVKRVSSKLATVMFEEADGERRTVSKRFDARVAEFVDVVRSNADSLRSIFLEVKELNDDETYTYLKSTISTVHQKVVCPPIPDCIDYYLPDEAFTPGLVPVLGEHVMLTCTVRGFPKRMAPDVLDHLNTLSAEYRWVTRYIFLGKEDSMAVANSYRRGFLQKVEAFTTKYGLFDGASAELGVAEAKHALTEIAADELQYGYLTTTVSVWGRDVETTRAAMNRVTDELRAQGLVVSLDPFGSGPAWLGSHPGNVTRNVRRSLVSTQNVADMLPVSRVWQGDPVNAFMRSITGTEEEPGEGSPHITCTTLGETPFFFNLNEGDLGNTWVVGSPGGGKSTLLAMLGINWMKYPSARVIVLDVDRSSRAVTLAMGGRMLELGNGKARSALQPLRNLEGAQERADAYQFVVDMFEAQGVEVTPGVHVHIDGALDSLRHREDKSQRTITQLSNYLSTCAREYANVLAPYCEGGAYGQVFDARENSMSDEKWLTLEMRQLLELPEEAVGPALMYVLRRVRRMCDGSPMLLIVDETPVYLKVPKFREFFIDALNTLRKKHVFVLFSTPQVYDVTGDEKLYSTVRASCPTTIFLPNPNLGDPKVRIQYEGLGLNDASVAAIERLRSKQEYYFCSSRGRQVFSLSLGEAQLAFSGMCSEKDHQFLDELERTKPKEQWVERILKYRGVLWAAKRVADKRAELAA